MTATTHKPTTAQRRLDLRNAVSGVADRARPAELIGRARHALIGPVR